MKRIYSDIQRNRFTEPNKQVLFLRFNPDHYIGTKFEIKARREYFETIDTINIDIGKIYLYSDGFTGHDMRIEIVKGIMQDE